MTRMMRTTGAGAALAVAAMVLLPACALRKGPPDPEKIQRKMTATLEGEKDLIRSKVASSERADNLIALLDDRDRLVAEQAKTVAEYRDRMKDLNADYDADRADFEKAAAVYNEDRAKWQGEFASLIGAMKAEATADEWKAISKYQLGKLNPREMAYKEAGGGS